MEEQTPRPLQDIAEETRYPIAAFHFVRRGLDYTVHLLHEDPQSLDEAQRHVSGQQLCEGLRDFALEQYGQLALTVLNNWNIRRTEDFGQIVFAMVNGGLMQATENDSPTDFDNCFDFDGAFAAEVSADQLAPEDPNLQLKSD